MLSERVSMMKKRLLSTKPSLSSERMVLVTEAYQKYAGDAVPIFRAKVFAYILDNMSLKIHDGELVVGSQNSRVRCASVFPEYTGSWLKEQISILPTRSADPLDVTPEDEAIILDYLKWWEGKSLEEQANDFLPDDVQLARRTGMISIGSRTLSTGHSTPDYQLLFSEGYSGLKAQCQAKIDEVYGGTPEKQEQIDFWDACIIVCDACVRFANRYADLAENMAAEENDSSRKAELLKIASTCRHVPENPPRDFEEALQFVWFNHLLFHLESNSSANCFGRFDQYMIPYYKKGIEDGTLNDEKVLELLESFYIKATEIIMLRPTDYSRDFAGYPMWQILMIGGIDRFGNDVTNELSYLCLDAAAELQIAQPALALRIHQGTPDALYDKAVEMIQRGMANPAFFNDKCAIQTVLNKGGTIEEARDWVIVGCIEPHQGGGGTDGSPSAGYLNFPKCLELVLHNGKDPLMGIQLGPETGDPTKFKTKEELMDAIMTQMDYFWTLIQKGFNKVIPYHATRLPAIFASMVMDGCIEKGLPIQKGGALHTYTGIFPTGPASLADAVAAIDKFVFDEKTLSMQELIDILDSNFEGHEDVRLMLLNRAPKYGNDDPYVDSICDTLIDHSADFVQQFKDSRGGTYCFCNQAQTVNVTMGAAVGATADGRFAGTPLSDNSAPAMGRDTSGPTCTVNSVGRNMHQTNVWDGTLFNLRFDPKGVAGDKGRRIIKSVIDEYFENDGLHIQINVVDDKTLRAAQKDPENYRNVIVRVAGYMAYFTELDKKVQDTIIERTAHLSA